MFNSYENLTSRNKNKEDAAEEAYEVIENGWVKRGYPNIDITKPIPWALSNQEDRTWNFYIHSWDIIDTFLYSYNKKPERSIFEVSLRIALEWINIYVKDAKPICIENSNDFAWYDMAVGLRAYRLAYIYDVYRFSNSPDQRVQEKLWNALLAHQYYLQKDENIAFHNNHGYFQAAGQVAMGKRFHGFSDTMSEALKQGLDRFQVMLIQQFSTEGVHREHSPDYHRMVYDTLIGVINSGLIEDELILALSRKIEIALSWFVLPNQRIANFGDSDWRIMRLNETKSNEKWQEEPMKFVTTNGRIGKLPLETLKVYEDAGYFIVRSKPEYPVLGYDEYSYLAQTAAFHSRTHKHADDLSFVWFDRGHNILIDSGRFGYIGKAEMGTELWEKGHWYTHPSRLYCESTRAHNTLEFDEKDYPRKGVKPYKSAIKRSKQYSNGLTILETECKHFKSIRRVRVLVYLPMQWLIVFDWFKDNVKTKHEVKQWFNFSEEITLKKKGNDYIAKLDTNTNLYIANLLGGAHASNIIKGSEEPKLQGWFSPAEREFVPIESINYRLNNIDTGSVATLLSFQDNIKTNLNLNSVNTSGRKFKLHWADINGTHILELRRELERDIEVTYQIKTQDINQINEEKRYSMNPINLYQFNPFEEIGINEDIRLVIHDAQKSEFIHFAEIHSKQIYTLDATEIANPAECKYKYQVKSHSKDNNQWIDIPEYRYVHLSKKHVTKALNYYFNASDSPNNFLVVYFLNEENLDDILSEFSNLPVNLLILEDKYEESEQVFSSYFLNGVYTPPVADLVQKTIKEFASSTSKENIKTIFLGNQKGGFASLYHGYIFGADQILVTTPYILLERHLLDKESKNEGVNDFKRLFGNLNKTNKFEANKILYNVLQDSKVSYPKVNIFSKSDGNVKYLQNFLDWINVLEVPDVSVSDINKVSDIKITHLFAQEVKNLIASVS